MTGARRIGRSDLELTLPLSLGGNVFGWTADEQASFAVLDAFAAAGGTLVDTADGYSAWAEGNVGGESERLIGRWMASRSNRDAVLVATKVGKHPELPGLSRRTIRAGVAASLERLQTDYIDLYYAHADDPDTPVEETVAAFGELVAEGTVRAVAASNYSAERLAQALRIADETGVARYEALQPHYNLVHRDEYEGDLAAVVAENGLSCLPYSSLASGFLTGKYRDGVEIDSPRAGGAGRYADDRGRRVLAALDAVAADHDTSVTAVSLAWLAAQPTVVAPIASARSAEQLVDVLQVGEVTLTGDELRTLGDAAA